MNELAHHTRRPNRVHFGYGLTVRLLLLSTLPYGNAVTVGYKPESVCFGADFHRSDRAPFQAHSFPRKRESRHSSVAIRFVLSVDIVGRAL